MVAPDFSADRFVSHYWGTSFSHFAASIQKHSEAVVQSWRSASKAAATLVLQTSLLLKCQGRSTPRKMCPIGFAASVSFPKGLDSAMAQNYSHPTIDDSIACPAVRQLLTSFDQSNFPFGPRQQPVATGRGAWEWMVAWLQKAQAAVKLEQMFDRLGFGAYNAFE